MLVSRILALLAAGAAIAPAAVSAAPVVTVSDGPAALVRQVHIQTDDLNLASTAGKRALQARVNNAISKVCSLNDIPDNFDNARCRQIAGNDARHQVADALARSTPRYAEAKAAPAPTNTASGS